MSIIVFLVVSRFINCIFAFNEPLGRPKIANRRLKIIRITRSGSFIYRVPRKEDQQYFVHNFVIFLYKILLVFLGDAVYCLPVKL